MAILSSIKGYVSRLYRYSIRLADADADSAGSLIIACLCPLGAAILARLKIAQAAWGCFVIVELAVEEPAVLVLAGVVIGVAGKVAGYFNDAKMLISIEEIAGVSCAALNKREVVVLRIALLVGALDFYFYFMVANR